MAKRDMADWKGGDWLETGAYIARIVSYREFTAKTGTKGIELEFDRNGQKAKGSWWLTESARGRYARVARHSGLTSVEELTNFQDDDLVGRMVGIVVEPDGEFHAVSRTFPHDSNPASHVPKPKPVKEKKDDDSDIPF